MPQAAKPDHWESVTRIKLPMASKSHKPADSGVPVGNGARSCSLQEVSLNAFKQPLSVLIRIFRYQVTTLRQRTLHVQQRPMKNRMTLSKWQVIEGSPEKAEDMAMVEVIAAG
jgi:hypothetical protein